MRLLASKRWIVALTFGTLVIAATSASRSMAQTGEPVSPDGLWEVVDDPMLPAGFLAPTEFLALTLDHEALEEILSGAPLESFGDAVREPGVEFTIPLPNGDFPFVAAVQTFLMEGELAADFPDISTYRFNSVDGSGVGGHMVGDTMEFNVAGTVQGDLLRIEPLLTDDGLIYLSYFDRNRTDGRNDFIHNDEEPSDPVNPPVPLRGSVLDVLQTGAIGDGIQPAAIDIGDEMRIYRFTMATTGEFYQANGGNDLAVLVSLIVRLIAVNAVFEPEVGVRLVLAANTIDVLFDDGTTDPFINANTPGMLRDENVTNAIAQPLNDADYDVGFLFSTGTGGGAAWYVVCLTTSNTFHKARGAGKFGNDGLNTGTGLILHEVGHQLGARHTYSGGAGGCNLANFDGDNGSGVPSAFAPGSGSTIMSYSKNCSDVTQNDNVSLSLIGAGQYYHAKSFEQITDNVFNGDGATCGTLVNTGNSAPTNVDAGPDFTIPRNTPFELVGSASDPDFDDLTFNWDQIDLATTQRDIDTDDGVGPIIRSVPPTQFEDRVIPDIRDLLTNFDRRGELLPQMDRDVNMRFTARDNRAGGGGVASDDMVVTSFGDPFFITAPNSGSLQAGCMVPVDWVIGGGDIAANVDITYSTTGGLEDIPMPVRQSFPTNIVLGTPNDGSHLMTVPCDLTDEARIKVKASDNIFFDVNDNDLTVENDPPVLTIDPIADGDVNDMCEFTLDFTATVTDSCGVAAADVDVDVSKEPPGEYTLGVPNISILQNGAGQVDVSGSVLVSDLLSSPAVVRIEIDAVDNCGATDSSFELVEVSDTTPPMISVSLDPDTLWPPNHKMVDITATVVATDNCPGVSFVLDSVTSDEPDNDVADGDTDNDIQGAEIGTPDLEFMLRAERAGTMDGRTYTATYEAEDGSGNTASDSDTVVVPHDQAM